MKNKAKNLFHLSWLQSLIFIIAFISSLASSPLVLQARSSVNNTAPFSEQFSKASFPLLGQDLLRQSDDKNAAVYDNDDDDFKIYLMIIHQSLPILVIANINYLLYRQKIWLCTWCLVKV